jgi:hypothetical protein
MPTCPIHASSPRSRSAFSTRLLLGAALVAGSLTPAGADVAVVPQQYETVQAAIDAVQGRPGAVVRIESDDTFVGALHVAASVAIEGGVGYFPTLEGRLNEDALVAVTPRSGAAIALRNLRLVPGAQATAVSAIGASSVEVSDVHLVVAGPRSHGFDIADVARFTLRDSVLDVDADPGAAAKPKSIGQFVGKTGAHISNNTFLLHGDARATWQRASDARVAIEGSTCAQASAELTDSKAGMRPLAVRRKVAAAGSRWSWSRSADCSLTRVSAAGSDGPVAGAAGVRFAALAAPR